MASILQRYLLRKLKYLTLRSYKSKTFNIFKRTDFCKFQYGNVCKYRYFISDYPFKSPRHRTFLNLRCQMFLITKNRTVKKTGLNI